MFSGMCSRNEDVIRRLVFTCSLQFQPEANAQMYINTIIVAMSNVLGFIVASSMVNIIGKKWLLGKLYFTYMCAYRYNHYLCA